MKRGSLHTPESLQGTQSRPKQVGRVDTLWFTLARPPRSGPASPHGGLAQEDRPASCTRAQMHAVEPLAAAAAPPAAGAFCRHVQHAVASSSPGPPAKPLRPPRSSRTLLSHCPLQMRSPAPLLLAATAALVSLGLPSCRACSEMALYDPAAPASVSFRSMDFPAFGGPVRALQCHPLSACRPARRPGPAARAVAGAAWLVPKHAPPGSVHSSAPPGDRPTRRLG